MHIAARTSPTKDKRRRKARGDGKPRLDSQAGAASKGPGRYDRMADLPRLLQIWPHQIAALSIVDHGGLVERLRTALRQERQRGLARRWSYDLSRHAALLTALRAETALLAERRRVLEQQAFHNPLHRMAPAASPKERQKAPAALGASSTVTSVQTGPRADQSPFPVPAPVQLTGQ